MNKNIHKAAKKFIKNIKGEIDFLNVEKYINYIGYKIVFFNTPDGDIEIVRYNKIDEAKENDAFTYCGNAKIIFINADISSENKLYLLLHEVGHIILGHIGDGKSYTRNKILSDIEADTFVNAVLNPPKSKLHLYIALILVLASLAGISVGYHVPEEVNTISTSQTFGSNAFAVPQGNPDDLVYVTLSGTKYHRSDCRYTKDKDCTTLTRKDAAEKHAPCSVCKP